MNALTITPTDDQAAVLSAMNARANPPTNNPDGTTTPSPVTDEDFAANEIGTFLDTLVKNERSTQLQNLLQGVQQVAATGAVGDLTSIAAAVDQAKTAISARQPPPIEIKPPQ